MDVAQLQQQVQQLVKANEELRRCNEELRCRNEELAQTVEQLQQENQTLRHDYEALAGSTQTLMESREKLQQRVEELEAANQRLVDMLWGRRSERRPVSPDQLSLAFQDEESGNEEDPSVRIAMEAEEQLLRNWEARRRRRRGRRRDSGRGFPEHLERRERVLDLPEEEKVGLKYIGDAVSERLRFEKPHVYVERIIRRKYVVDSAPQQGVFAPSPPLAIMEGCRYDFGVIAAILEHKFAFHCPTYRQQDWFAQCGWSPSRSTINELINASVVVLRPLYDWMWQLVLRQSIIYTDDSRVVLLTRGALNEQQQAALQHRKRRGQPPDGEEGPEQSDGGSVTRYAWLYTTREIAAPYNVFHWSLTHQHAVVDAHLADWRGIVVGDGYSGYTGIEKRTAGRIVHASCNAHARREFTKAESTQPLLAAQAISFYAQLYDIEERGRNLDAAALLALRQREAVPIWDRFGQWLESDPVRAALPRSPLGRAVTYVRNQWEGLRRYLGDGRLAIDNQLAEQAIRPLAVGRRNWLFLGHPAAAEGRLQLVSIISSAMRHHVVVIDYLEDVLAKLADAAQNHPADLNPGAEYLTALLPDRWAAAHGESVRQARIEENQAVSEAKRARRARRRILQR